ncbi:Cytochrome P450 [Penicillium sp. CMV-2018d]|nr:Cytochrome P450 [Penicillium sp. CMV-2018d]
MDPFSITTGVLGITGFALSSINNLRSLIDGLKEAEDVLQDVTSNLEAIQLPLSALRNIQISDRTTYDETKKDLEKTGVAEAVNNCGEACVDFTKKLKQWTKHSSTAKLSLRDRLSVGLWNKEKIQTFRTRVSSCRAIVQFAIGSAQLVILIRSENTSTTAREETKKQLLVLGTSIQENTELIKRKQEEALQRKKELESPEDEDEGEDDAQRTLAIQETEQQSRVLEAEQTASRAVSEIISKFSVPHVTNAYNNYFTGANSGLQVGHSTGIINWTTPLRKNSVNVAETCKDQRDPH